MSATQREAVRAEQRFLGGSAYIGPDPARSLNQAETAALCLSGGGVRSAAFCLGVLQALAEKGCLCGFHYLSTVSGGGYCGAFLSALIRTLRGSERLAEDRLRPTPASDFVANLRQYTNFLAPSPGHVGADARTGILILLRNIALTWILVIPALFAASLLPLAYAALLGALDDPWYAPRFSVAMVVLLVAGALTLLVAVFKTCLWLPSYVTEVEGKGSGTIHTGITAEVILWSLILPVWFAYAQPQGVPKAAVVALAILLLMCAGYGLACWRVRRGARSMLVNFFRAWIWASILDVFLLGLGVFIASRFPDIRLLAVIGPLWIVLAHSLHSTIEVGLRGRAERPDLDREWLARLNADTLGLALVLAAWGGVTVYGSWLIAHIGGVATGIAGFAISGTGSAILGWSSKTLAVRQTPRGEKAPAVQWEFIEIAAALIAAFFLFAGLARVGEIVLAALSIKPDSSAAVVALLVLAAAGASIGLVLGTAMNVNRFSMHDTYRNRLVRAFPGSARLIRAAEPLPVDPLSGFATRRFADRRADQFTGFDERDNLAMSDLIKGRRMRRLYPIVNVTLNLIATRRNSMAERKAASFVFTPLHSGSGYLDPVPAPGRILPATRRTAGVFVQTRRYAGRETRPAPPPGGVTLGTAMAISGAAVSPSRGYQSSPATAFLMTLFSARLGAWLPNPAQVRDPTALNRGKPPNALKALLNEALGMVDDTRSAIFLSDGGHFDNLGVYEMLRRQCRFILAVDAGQDGDYAYADLGAVLRRAAIDFDIRFAFDRPITPGRAYLTQPASHAWITYADGTRGQLLYLKPHLPYGTPPDILAYKAAHAAFPHETTANQFFTESQFESYRHLGYFLGLRLWDGPAT